MFEAVALALFWLCLAAMIHTYLLYPLSLWLWPKRYALPPDMPENSCPTVAVLVPAYNEDKVIEAKVRNCLELNYPADKLEILVGSDGSTDRTGEIVRRFTDPRVRLVELSGRHGKTGVLNHLVTQTTAEFVVFTDSNVTLETAALRTLIRHFADPQVSVAGGGKYIRIAPGAGALYAEALYADFENWIRGEESKIGGMSGTMGSFMAMRRDHYKPFAPGALNDDTVPTIWATLDGFRNAFDPEAKADEDSGCTVYEEFRRRLRIGAGNFQTLFRYAAVLSPRYGIAAYTYFSHKVLRWIFPFLMIGLFAANCFLLHEEFYRAAMVVQVAGYGVVLLGFLLDRLGVDLPVVTYLYHFVALNIALGVGFFVYLRGITTSAWEPTAREA